MLPLSLASVLATPPWPSSRSLAHTWRAAAIQRVRGTESSGLPGSYGGKAVSWKGKRERGPVTRRLRILREPCTQLPIGLLLEFKLDHFVDDLAGHNFSGLDQAFAIPMH